MINADFTNKVILTGIHTIITILVYLLMIFLMTYNVYIVFSIVIGNAIGYYLFAFDDKNNIRKNSNLGCCHAGWDLLFWRNKINWIWY